MTSPCKQTADSRQNRSKQDGRGHLSINRTLLLLLLLLNSNSMNRDSGTLVAVKNGLQAHCFKCGSKIKSVGRKKCSALVLRIGLAHERYQSQQSLHVGVQLFQICIQNYYAAYVAEDYKTWSEDYENHIVVFSEFIIGGYVIFHHYLEKKYTQK